MGTCMSCRHVVSWHISQWKCVCMSVMLHSFSPWQTSYLMAVPSSTSWVTWCSRNRLSVRKMLDLSMSGNSSSSSEREQGRSILNRARRTSIRLAVGFTPLPLSISSSVFIAYFLMTMPLPYCVSDFTSMIYGPSAILLKSIGSSSPLRYCMITMLPNWLYTYAYAFPLHPCIYTSL